MLHTDKTVDFLDPSPGTCPIVWAAAVEAGVAYGQPDKFARLCAYVERIKTACAWALLEPLMRGDVSPEGLGQSIVRLTLAQEPPDEWATAPPSVRAAVLDAIAAATGVRRRE